MPSADVPTLQLPAGPHEIYFAVDERGLVVVDGEYRAEIVVAGLYRSKRWNVEGGWKYAIEQVR